jgi:pimeloyl-ACP methyl ester carboxylesterase
MKTRFRYGFHAMQAHTTIFFMLALAIPGASFGNGGAPGECPETVAAKSISAAELIGPQWELPWTLNHTVSGEQHQETIVLIHGLTGDFRTFQNVARSLSHFYRVVSVDLRGMGNTPAYGWNYSSKVLAKDIAVLLKHLEKGWAHPPSGYHVLGHSFGARVAIRFCDEFPTMARSLIVEDMHFAQYNGSGPVTVHKSAEKALELMKTKNPGCNRRQMARDNNPALWKTLGDKEFVVPLFAAQVRNEEYSAELKRLKVPLLLVAAAGFNGALNKDGVAHARRHLRPGNLLQVTPISNTGHDVHNDNADEYLRVVGTFIANVLQTAK